MFRKRIQLALIHLAVAMTLVPINSTLNRVMIKEMAISATLVAILASLPYLFSPLQVVIGSYSDRHPWLGYRRTPYIALGLVLCVLGVILAPAGRFPAAGQHRCLGCCSACWPLAPGAWASTLPVCRTCRWRRSFPAKKAARAPFRSCGL